MWVSILGAWSLHVMCMWVAYKYLHSSCFSVHLFMFFSKVDLKLFTLSGCNIFFPDSLEARGDHVLSSGKRSILDRTSSRAVIFMKKGTCSAIF